MRIFLFIIFFSCAFFNIHSSDTHGLKLNKISYEVDGKPLEFVTYLQTKNKIDNKFLSRLNGIILLKLYEKNNIKEIDEVNILEIVYQFINSDDQRKNMTEVAVRLSEKIAQNIIIMHDQKLSAIETYNLYIKEHSEIPLKTWLNAACDYTYDWAKNYMGYNEMKKRASLFASPNITMAKSIVLARKIASECPDDMAISDKKAYVEEKIKSQINDLSLVIPKEYENIRNKLIQKLSRLSAGIEIDPNTIPPVNEIIKYIQVQN